MEGSLSSTPVTEVLRDIRGRRGPVVLQMSDGASRTRIYFRNGDVIFASSDCPDDRLGERLVRDGRLSRDQLELACRVRATSKLRLGATLVEMGCLSAADLDERVREQILSIVRASIGWSSGSFTTEVASLELDSDLERRDLSTRNLVLEGVREHADTATVRATLQSLHGAVTHAGGAAMDETLTLTPAEGFVLSRVDGYSSAEEIASVSPLGEDETYRCLYGLVTAGIIEIEEAFPEPPEEGTALPVSSLPEEVVRFRDAMIHKHAQLGEVTHYELLGIAPDATAAEVKRAYFGLAKKLHPDHRAGLKLEDPDGVFAHLYLEIKAAYDVLSSETERRRYDSSSVHPRAASSSTTAPTPPRSFDTSQQARIHFTNGARFFEQARFHEAIEELRSAVRLDEVRPDHHRLLARALAKNPKWRKLAEEHFIRALELDRFDVQTYVELGELYESSGLATRARKMFEDAIGIDPDNPKARDGLDALGPSSRQGVGKARRPGR